MTRSNGNLKAGGSYYMHAPKMARYNRPRLISPEVMTVVAWRYERGEKPKDIAFCMALPLAAVSDIIATYEYRAQRYFGTRRQSS